MYSKQAFRAFGGTVRLCNTSSNLFNTDLASISAEQGMTVQHIRSELIIRQQWHRRSRGCCTSALPETNNALRPVGNGIMTYL